MADNSLDLNINIGANISDLDSAMQKAQNLLAQFQAALKKATNVGEIQYLNNQIENLGTTIKNINGQMANMSKPTADATNALTNLSRVAQDAPYGFMGIANNLNPMLESFQRLQKESGSTGNALKAMVSGLAGPAGLGLALGVVSSLVVKFGGDLSKFFSELVSGKNTMDEYLSSIHDSQKAYVQAYSDMYKLKQAFEDYHKGLMSQKEILQKYNNTLGDTYGKTNDVAEAERVWANNSENFIKAAVLRAAAMLEIEKAAKKAAEAYELSKKPKEEFTSYKTTIAMGLESEYGNDSVKSLQTSVNILQKKDKAEAYNAIKKEEQGYLDIVSAIEKEIEALKKKADVTKFIGQDLPKEQKEKKPKNENVDNLKEESAEIQRLVREYKELTRPSHSERRSATMIENESPKLPDMTKKKFDKEPSMEIKLYEANVAKLDKQLKAAQANAENFAQSLSGTLTNGIMSMWDALERGDNVLEAFGNFIKDLVKQLAAAVLQAILFKTIMSALGYGGVAGGGGGMGGLGAGLGSILGFAEGGIVSRPTIAMVGEGGHSEAIMPLNKLGNMMNSTFNAGAMSGQGGGGNGQFVLKGNDLVLALNRSNYSLNLRRGA